MLFILLSGIVSFYPVAVPAVEPWQVSNPVSPIELKKGIKVVIPEKEGFSSLKIGSSFFGESDAVLNFILFFRKPHDYALYMLDNFDSTPIFVVTHGDCIMYDPLKDNISYIQNAGVVYEVGVEREQFILRGAFDAATDHLIGKSKPLTKNTVVVDLLSIVNQMTIDLKSKRIDQNKFLLTGYTKRESYCAAQIDPTADIPVVSLMIFPKGQKNPIFAFNKIETEITIEDKIFMSPFKRLGDSKLRLIEMDINEIKKAYMSQLAKAVFIRSAIRHVELRGGIAQMGFQNIDWPYIKSRDDRLSSILRKKFPIKEIKD